MWVSKLNIDSENHDDFICQYIHVDFIHFTFDERIHGSQRGSIGAPLMIYDFQYCKPLAHMASKELLPLLFFVFSRFLGYDDSGHRVIIYNSFAW